MEKVWEFVSHKEFYLPIVYIVIGFLLYRIIAHFLGKGVAFIGKGNKKKNKRANTIHNLIKNVIKYVIIIFVVLAILTVYGINVGAILAGFGVVGVVLGLALQDMMKDFIAGISIILEDQFDIGDTIEVDGFMGEVIALSLKTTRIKNYTGSIKIIANRNVTNIINYSAANSLAVVDIGVSYESNNDQVEKLLLKAIQKIQKEVPHLKGEVKLLGINALEDSAVIYRIAVETISMEHYGVERAMRKIIKQELDKNNIKIPYPQVEVHHGE